MSQFLRDEKPISLKGSEDASGHGRSSRDANSTGSITDFNWNQRDICLTKFGNENTLRNHLLTHVETYNRVEGAIELDGKEKEEQLKVSVLKQKLCESKKGLLHTALDRTRNEATESRTTTDAVIVTCCFCGFT